MKFKVDNVSIQYNEKMESQIILTTKQNSFEDVQELKAILSKGKELIAEVKQFKVKRSLDSNSYCWILCQKVAEALHTTKELVYKKFIKEVGQFELMPIKNEAVERWQNVWSSKGLGWFSEVLEDSKLEGYKKVISYYGSSCYSVPEMCKLINEIVYQCKELNIETMTPAQIEQLNNQWGSKIKA